VSACCFLLNFLLSVDLVCFSYVLPLIVMVVTFASHTLWFGRPLDASTVFSSIGVFDVLRNQLHMLFWQIPMTIQGALTTVGTDFEY
jgi:hypothetical protein